MCGQHGFCDMSSLNMPGAPTVCMGAVQQASLTKPVRKNKNWGAAGIEDMQGLVPGVAMP